MRGIQKVLLLGAILGLLCPLPLQAQEWTYTVRPGDNLWNLSERYLSSMRYWRELQVLNHITDPKKLQPGSRLNIPVAWLKVRPAPVRVLTISGEVSFQSETQGKKKPLFVGALLHIEDAIRTGPKSSVSLVFADGSHLLLQANSDLKFDVIQSYGETGMVDSLIRLKKGRLRTTVTPKEATGGRFEIHTPGAITAIRGTKLRMMSDPDRGISSTEVLTGRVDVIAGGSIQSVVAGFGTVVKLGEPPSVPSVLLQAPKLSGLPDTLNQLPLHFIWPSLAGAEGYRIQLSKTKAFDVLDFDDTLEKPELILSDLPNGPYVMRVRGIDDLALEGFNAVHHFSLAVPPSPPPKPVQKKPPFLLTPPFNEVIDLETPEFEWEAVPKADLYRFQIADRADFFSPLMDIADFSEPTIRSQPLKPGLYYWRVAAADASGKYGLFSPSHTFRIRAKASILKLAASQLEDTQLQIQWQGGKPSEHYQVELARDAAFLSLVSQQALKRASTSFDRPDAGLYYFRVRAITSEGVVGDYTAAQTIEIPQILAKPPLLLRPPFNEVIDLETPEFKWEAVSKADSYRFQIAEQADFFSPLMDVVDFSEPTIRSKPLKPGLYYWRVAAADGSGKYGLFSPSQTFRVRAKASMLKLEASQLEDKYLQIHWMGGKPSEHYEVELARDADFFTLVSQQELDRVSTSFDRPDPGLYYLRVRAITSEGIVGDYTAAQTIEVPSRFCRPFLLIFAVLLALL